MPAGDKSPILLPHFTVATQAITRQPKVGSVSQAGPRVPEADWAGARVKPDPGYVLDCIVNPGTVQGADSSVYRMTQRTNDFTRYCS